MPQAWLIFYIFYNFMPFYYLLLQEVLSPQVRVSTAIVPFTLQCLPLCCSSENSHSRFLSCIPRPQETEHVSHCPQSPQTPSAISSKISLYNGKKSKTFGTIIVQNENEDQNKNYTYLVSGMSRCYSFVRLRFGRHRKRFHHWIHTFQLP